MKNEITKNLTFDELYLFLRNEFDYLDEHQYTEDGTVDSEEFFKRLTRIINTSTALCKGINAKRKAAGLKKIK